MYHGRFATAHGILCMHKYTCERVRVTEVYLSQRVCVIVCYNRQSIVQGARVFVALSVYLVNMLCICACTGEVGACVCVRVRVRVQTSAYTSSFCRDCLCVFTMNACINLNRCGGTGMHDTLV